MSSYKPFSSQNARVLLNKLNKTSSPHSNLNKLKPSSHTVSTLSPITSQTTKKCASRSTITIEKAPKRQKLFNDEDEYLVKWLVDDKFSIVKRKHFVRVVDVELEKAYELKFGAKILEAVVKYIGKIIFY